MLGLAVLGDDSPRAMNRPVKSEGLFRKEHGRRSDMAGAFVGLYRAVDEQDFGRGLRAHASLADALLSLKLRRSRDVQEARYRGRRLQRHQSAARTRVSFEEIAALGCHIEGEHGQKMTPELIAAWYEEEKEADRYHRL